ncbi:MAG TPA: alpha/beta hydrolase [Chloroflexia bacterium]|nr:alpha/beta hydrolase [Chloroflexia bacterium]
MHHVTSKDGTAIAFDRLGEGRPLILVNGALSRRADAASVAASLAPQFTVFAYDRRGRGDSGDTPPYAIEREIEDIAALLAEAGGTAYVFGHSSGAILALEAARLLAPAITKLAVYEPPFIVDDRTRPLPEDYVTRLAELVAADRRGAAVTYWMTTVVRVPDETLASMQNAPMWHAFEAMAPTLVYDATISADYVKGKPLPSGKWASVTIPTLVMDGGESPAMMHSAALALTAILPNAQHRRFPGQGHGVAAEVLVPVLVEFFHRDTPAH